MTIYCTTVESDSALQHDAAAALVMPSSLRLVLDTNAVLDWLLFRDKGFAPISAAIESGAAVALTNGECLEELRHVLRYPEFKLDQMRQAELLAQYLRHACVVDVTMAMTPDGGEPISTGIPRCRDPDDQKFLELAWQQRTILVTKDKLLLQLARRVEKGGRFRILRPDLLVQRYLNSSVAAVESIV